MKTKREKGKKLEYFVADKLNEIGIKARITRNSGGSTEIGDVQNDLFYIECKNHNKRNIIMKIKDWNHLLARMPINTQKTPIYVFRNNENKNFVILDLNDFFRLIRQKL